MMAGSLLLPLWLVLLGLPEGGAGWAGAGTGPERTPPVVRARAVEGDVRIDGVLDEEVWRRATPAAGFIQSEPREGEPASESTEVRVAYDERFLFVGARLEDRAAGDLVVNDLRRDFEPGDQDSFEVLLDTFHDRRNGYVFAVSVGGARTDYQVSNDGYEVNINWDAPWRARTRRGPDGWTVEMAIPFSALRFDPDRSSTWGINFARRIRRRNEVDFWAPVPRSQGLYTVSLAGELDGLPRAMDPGRDLRLTPYVAASATRATGGDHFVREGDVGVDLKYGLGRSLTLDVTVNPDFAQVEADEQQVNLTQFPVLFPEKRDFFLENSGTFYLGDDTRREGLGLQPRYDSDLIPFFSRRIGLTPDGRPVPISGGLRVTGRAAGFSVGALGVRTEDRGELPTSDWGVLRVKREVRDAVEVGGIFMARAAEGHGNDHNLVYGADANVRLPWRVDLSTFVLGTRTPGVTRGDYAYRATVTRRGNFLHLKAGVLELGEGFHSDLSFYRRTGARKWMLDTGLRPRYESLRAHGIRELHPHVVWNYYENLDGRMAAKKLHSGVTAFFNNGGHVQLAANPTFERIGAPLTLHRDVAPIPAGGYSWTDWKLDLTTDPSRPFALVGGYTWGGLWTGSQRTVDLNVTARPSSHVRASVGFQRTRANLDLPDARFVTWLWTARANYSFNTNMFVDALVQYDDERDVFNANVRFNLVHAPLSDIYVVYNEQQYVNLDGSPPGRSLILKVTQMVGF